MSYVLRSPSPGPSSRDEQRHDVDSLSAALHAALQPFSVNHVPSHALPPTLHPEHEMQPKEKVDKTGPSLEIVVNSDTLCLRGTGVDVNPALLSGNVVLHLSEPTAIKEITLQFRGKARLPVSAADSMSLSNSQITYLVCNHEWSFLEGDKHHSHTLKAGRHLFPFQLQIGGSLPCSIATTALGGASVHYKLRATAVRPGFAGLTHRELHASCPISILRGFSAEALEYQQTLEIENTWPEKLMYSIMIPHKAWAAGERLTAVVKFSPLVKGARVLNVATTVNETVKLYARGGTQENTRVVASARHDIIGGKAVCVEEQHHRYRIPLLTHGHQTPARMSTSTPASPGTTTPHHTHMTDVVSTGNYFPNITPSLTASPTHSPAELAPLTTTTTNSSSSSGSAGLVIAPRSSSHATRSNDAAHAAGPSSANATPDPNDDDYSSDVVTTLEIAIPMHATPSHSLEPIQVTHRIRWSILIANLDGHTSELRCSLPLHILDNRLLDEARAATAVTRRLLLGLTPNPDDETALPGDDDDQDLPSYPAHVRDRVANAYLPDNAVMRVANAWVMHGVSPTIIPHAAHHGGSHSGSDSGVHSPAPLETWSLPNAGHAAHMNHAHPRNHLPHEPAPGAQPLEWVNTELLLSLSREAPEAPVATRSRNTPPSRTPPPENASASGSRHGSRFSSRRNSRANSRAASPERGSGVASPASGVPSAPMHGPDVGTYVHSGSQASRNTQGLFSVAMKPFTSIGSTFSLSSRSPSHTNLHGLQHGTTLSGPTSANASSANLVDQHLPLTSSQQLHRAFTEVPDYDMASRGFLGGGITPLSSLRGLPSYEAAQAQAEGRSYSDTDLAGRFAHAAQAQRQHRDSPLSMSSARSAPPTPPITTS